MCARCFASAPFKPSIKLSIIKYLSDLKQSGYPFGKNKLELEVWHKMREYEQTLDKIIYEDSKKN